jgi:hypothetical protein
VKDLKWVAFVVMGLLAAQTVAQKTRLARRDPIAPRPQAPTQRADQPAKQENEPAVPLKDIRIVYQLDPRLTSGLYMGERWVTPPTYIRMGQGKECIFEVRVEGTNVKGNPIKVNAQWSASDPDMVTIVPSTVPNSKGRQFKITVRRPGECSLKVSAGAMPKDSHDPADSSNDSSQVSKELLVKGTERLGFLQIAISPKKESPRP